MQVYYMLVFIIETVQQWVFTIMISYATDNVIMNEYCADACEWVNYCLLVAEHHIFW